MEKSKRKQQLGKGSESRFEQFCVENDIRFEKIDDIVSEELKLKYLKEISGKRPDYWCSKNGKEIFVEVKTLTNFTNQKREKSIEKAIEEIQKRGEGFGMTSELFDPIPELKGPLKDDLSKASGKFKNLKDDFTSPRVLLLFGMGLNPIFTAHALFIGAYETYRRVEGTLVYNGLKKTKEALFDSTGSNVSAVVYRDNKFNCFHGIENPKAIYPFPEETFRLFFQVDTPFPN